MLIGLARSSIEDILVICNLLSEDKVSRVDLRPEIRKMREFSNCEASLSEGAFELSSIDNVAEESQEIILLSQGIF